MMKRLLLLLMISCATMNAAFAQNERGHDTKRKTNKAVVVEQKRVDSLAIDSLQRSAVPIVGAEPAVDLPLPLPSLTMGGQVEPLGYRPWFWASSQRWDLHPGLNLNVGASVFAQFGKNAPRGAGFMQNISAMYAQPLGKKFTVAAGGYFNNVLWGGDNYRNAGLQAVVGYRFNDQWEGYLYGQKSLVKNKLMPYLLHDMQALGDRIGATVKYNVNPYLSVQVSLEQVWGPNMPRGYYDSFSPMGH